MVYLALTGEKSGVISAVSSLGHASEENAAACSAISSLLRTFAVVLEQIPSVKLAGNAPNRGEFYCRIEKFGNEYLERIKGVCDFLLTGLRLIKQDFPNDITLDINWNG